MNEKTLSPSLSPAGSRRVPRVLVWTAGILFVIFVLLQVVRFVIPQFKLDNPPVTQNVVWNSSATKQLWKQACGDCHSNETVYPWYSYVAPVGWLVAHDIHEGRDALNISEDRRIEWDEMVEVIRNGKMPMPIYLVMHPEANLSEADKQTLIDGLRLTFSGN